jgi:hypothetical protein
LHKGFTSNTIIMPTSFERFIFHITANLSPYHVILTPSPWRLGKYLHEISTSLTYNLCFKVHCYTPTSWHLRGSSRQWRQGGGDEIQFVVEVCGYLYIAWFSMFPSRRSLPECDGCFNLLHINRCAA